MEAVRVIRAPRIHQGQEPVEVDARNAGKLDGVARVIRKVFGDEVGAMELEEVAENAVEGSIVELMYVRWLLNRCGRI